MSTTRATCPLATALHSLKLRNPDQYARLLDRIADDIIDRASAEYYAELGEGT